MKKISVLIAIIGLSASVLVSCKNEEKKSGEPTAENQHKEHKGEHPPHHDGDRKGPPHGGDKKGPPQGSPEQTKTLEEIGGYKIGDVATDFNLKNVDGTMVSLAGLENAKGYIVTFTCNECPFSKLYEDRLIALNNEYAPKGYPVIAINPNSPENVKEGYEAMQARAKEKGFTFPYLVDEGQKIYPQYGAVRTPHVFLLDAERKVQYIGTIDDNAKSPEDVKVKFVEDAIEALEKGEKPEPSLTKAIGCPIKANQA
ncbi:redoxin domain-containing protein [Winogradskyella undariae]|uniref:thioredoxin family protein n=1 Tax=Winogradskyella TaxID=286104 RepID=UPI00156BD1C7|nr:MULTISPECIES: thioredoxin family protein [Winogradskyella]NRR90728.1 redoxin domain-containing protein [Winogradskyella undariae]QXP79498.1 redoxin domain-containing protein [Winogradskyella sp. HaHa_3_26]